MSLSKNDARVTIVLPKVLKDNLKASWEHEHIPFSYSAVIREILMDWVDEQ